MNSNNKSNDKPASVERNRAKIMDTKEDTLQEKTPKEQECYRLYQKMTNLGLSVSYDTILRGLLKPTELRMLEKQKKTEATMLEDIQEQQNSINIESSEKDK